MRSADLLPSLLVGLLLAGCAPSALELAPDRPDRPWTPATDANGALVPRGQRAPGAEPGYVLPSNPALRSVPAPPSDLDPQRAYSLPELIDLAQSSNPTTRVAWNEARNVALAAGIARSTYLPRLSAGIVGGYQNGSDDTTVRDFGSDDDVRVTGTISALSLQWLLFDFGRRDAVIAAAEQGSLITNIAFTAAHQRVIYDVSLAFYAHAAALARSATAARASKNARDVQAAAEDRYEQGVGTLIEAAQARQGTAKARLLEVQAEGLRQDSYLALLAAMGVSPLTRVKVADVSQQTLSAALSEPIEQFVAAALARRPDMLSASAARAVSLAQLRAAESAFLPKVFASGTGSYARGNLDVTSLPEIGDESATVNLSQRRFRTTLFLGVTVPIFDGGAREAVLEQARAKLDESDARLAEVRNEAVRQVVAAANAATSSLSAHDAALALEAAAQTTFDAALESYRQGVGSITIVALAETQLLEAENAAADARSQALAAAATLALSAGTLGGAPR